MLSCTHTLAVLTEGWAAITANVDTWADFFASQVYPEVIPSGETEPVSASRILFAALTGDNAVDIDMGIVFGRAKLPYITISAGDERVINEAIGQNFVPSQVAWSEEQGSVTIDVMARTRAQCEAMHIAVKGLMLRAKYKLCSTVANSGYNYMNAYQSASRGPQAFGEITKEGFGGFRAFVRWTFERHDDYPPILAQPQAPAYLSIHAFDAVDQWGNHGKVRTSEPEE